MVDTRSDVNFCSALCKETIDKIPVSERRVKPCIPKKGGVNIHEATSTENPNGPYSLCNLSIGNFLFSISQEIAEYYLPNHIKNT